MRKIVVLSDSHGDIDKMRDVINSESPETVIFLGDFVRDIRKIVPEFKGIPFVIVSGNNDILSDFPYTATIHFCGKKIFASHGHLYKYTELVKAARDICADIVVFGHTHSPFIQSEDALAVMNPGSIRYSKTYGVITDDGNIFVKDYK